MKPYRLACPSWCFRLYHHFDGIHLTWYKKKNCQFWCCCHEVHVYPWHASSGLTFTWWGCYDLCQRHKPAELAHSFFSVLVSVSVFVALSTVFHSINFPDSHLFSHSVLPVLSLPYWSFQLLHLFMKVSLSCDVTPSYLGSQQQLSNLPVESSHYRVTVCLRSKLAYFFFMPNSYFVFLFYGSVKFAYVCSVFADVVHYWIPFRMSILLFSL